MGYRLLLIAMAVGCFVGSREARAEVRVTLSTGERVMGHSFGSETDTSRLAVQREAEGIVIARLIPWRKVASVRWRGENYTGEDLRKRLLETPQKPATGQSREPVSHSESPASWRPGGEAPPCIPPLHCRPIDARVLSVRDDPLRAYPEAVGRHFPHGIPLSETVFALHLMRAKTAQDVLAPGLRDEGVSAPPAPQVPPSSRPPSPAPGEIRGEGATRLQSISVAAEPISRYGKVDWDALRMELRAVDGRGQLTSAGGTLRVTLLGQEQKFIRSSGHRSLDEVGEVREIASWTRAIGGTGPQPVHVVLPLPRPLPEHDLSLAPFGELQVRLVVPGQGVFETTQRNILLRHISRLRDRQLDRTGSRFFAGESTSDSRRRSGLNFRQPSPFDRLP